MLDLQGIQQELKTHCDSLGVFDDVVTFDPGSALASGTLASIMFFSLDPDRDVSGLNITSAKVKFKIRIWKNATTRPHFNIDLEIMQAAETLIGSLHENITFNWETKDPNGDGKIMNIALFSGDNFGAQTGYINTEEGVYKAVDVTIPLKIADVWLQERS